MAHVNLTLEKSLRVLLVIFVLFNAVIPASLVNARSGAANEVPKTEEQANVFWDDLTKSLLQTSCATSGVLEISNGQTCSLNSGSYTFDSVTINSGGTLLILGNLTTGTGVTISSPVITVNGTINTDMQGYPANSGPGTGPNLWLGGGSTGGGHGGHGGIGSSTSEGGATYGDLYNPVTLGSGGGSGSNGSVGGTGGGAIHLIVNDTLTLNGIVSANGGNGHARFGAGAGGAGGSIWIEANPILGSGQILANGGTGANRNGHSGGGGGGRIAIYTANTFPSTIQISANGGNGFQSGDPGTIFLDGVDASLSTLTTNYSSIIANGTSAATITVTLKNIDGIPVPNRLVELVINSGSGLFINNDYVAANEYVAIDYTDENGIATATLKTVQPGEREIIARSGQILLSPTSIAFVAGPVSPLAFNSQVDSSLSSVPADGQTPVTITVTARDAQDNPISGANVVLSATGGAAITQPSTTTNSQGKTTGQILNTAAGSVTVTATVNGIELSDTAEVMFTSIAEGDLSISMTAPGTAVLGAALDYGITIFQTGSASAENTTVELTLPSDVSYVSQNAPVPPIITGQVLTWNFGLIEAGAPVTFVVIGRVSNSVSLNDVLEAQVEVSSIPSDVNPSNNVDSVETSIQEGYVFSFDLDQSSHIASIGAATEYSLTIKNTGLMQDSYVLSVDGLSSQNYSLPLTNVSILPGEAVTVPLTVQFLACNSEETTNFSVEVASLGNQHVETKAASIHLTTEPQVSGMAPLGGQILGGQNATVQWQTNIQTTAVLTVYPVGHPEEIETFTIPEGTFHSVVVPNLEWDTTYTWAVDITSVDCSGTTAMPDRQFTIAKGLEFVTGSNRTKAITVNHDYNQRMDALNYQPITITVRNNDTQSHTLTASVLNPYSGQEDILINFVDGGSVDETIELGPGETRQVALAIHTQDAKQPSYDFTATLVADGNGMHDNMTLHVEVLSEGDYTIEEVSFDEVTLARTYRITNHGKTITDLSLDAVIPGSNLPAKVFVQPNLDHVRLETGQSILFTVYPVFTAEDAAQSAAASLQQNSSLASSNSDININLKTVQPSTVSPINYELQASGSGVQKRATGSVSCGGGKSIVPVVMQDCTMTFETKDWYCTNRPSIFTPIIIPAFIIPESISSASLDIVYSPQSDVQPHSGLVSFNGSQNQIGAYGIYANQAPSIPTGQYSFNIPASYFQSSVAGNALQTVQMQTLHTNPGHYVSATGYQLNIGISQATTFVCADSQTSATQIVQQQYACNSVRVFNWRTDIFGPSTYFGGFLKTILTSIKGVIDSDGNLSNVSCTQKACGDPINTKNGSSSFTVSDLSFPTTAGDLIFQRSYSSITSDVYTDTLGPGWTYNHDARLIFADDPGGMEGFVLFKSVLGNQYLYKEEVDGSYTPGPGVLAALTKTATTYVVTSTEQERFIFDLNGRLLSREDANGNSFAYDYDGQGRLFKVSADGGTRFIQLGYDGQNRIVSVTDHASREVEFGYDANGDLTTYTDLLGQVWTYTYDTEHRQTEVLDPSGKETVRTEYDLQGRAYRQFDGEGKLLVMVVYNSDGSTTIYDGLNRSEEHQYNEHGIATATTNEVSQTETSVFDENFRSTSVSNDAGHTLQMTWSEDGQDMLSKTDPEGNTTSYTYDESNNLLTTTDPLSNTTTYTYDGNLLTSTTDASGNITTYTYTPEGYLESTTDWMDRTTSYTYDVHGQRISMTDPNTHTWQYEYDALGRLVLTTDPRGRKTFNEYDAAGQLLRTIQNYDPNRAQNDQNVYNIQTVYAYDQRGNQISVIDTFNRVTHYEYDDANRLIRTIDAAGNTTTNNYDAAGQLISTTDALGNKTTYQYDPSGRLIKTTNPLGVSTGNTTFNPSANTSTVTDIAGHSWTYYYDEKGRVVRVMDALGNSTYTSYDPNGNVDTRTDPLGRITSYDYDELNRLVTTTDANGGVTETIYNEDGQRVATFNALDHQTAYTYDAQGRLVATTDPLARITQTEYDQYGRRTASIDAAGHRTEYTYDLLDRVVTVEDAMGNITTTTYDVLGNVLSRTDANGNATTYTYDTLNRVLTVTDPNGRTTTNAYDAAGNLVSVTNDLNEATIYGYDALNRQVSVSDPLNHTTQTTYNQLGQVSSIIAPDGTVTYYEYDALGRQVAVILNYKPAAQSNADTNVRYEYTYNAVGNRVSVKDPKGNITTYGYDALNHVVSMTDPLNRTTSYTYDLAGRQTSMTDGNGKTTYFTYDAAGQLTLIDYPDPDDDVAFSYDLNGQRIGMTDGLGDTTWTYDPLNRPLSVSDPNGSAIGYGYDPVGNRTQLTYPNNNVVAYTYDDANQLVSVTDWDSQVTSYGYDDAGRITSVSRPNGVDSEYQYDLSGRVTGVNHDNGVSSLASYAYTYDPAGNIAQVVENVPVIPSQYNLTVSVVGDGNVNRSSEGPYESNSVVTLTAVADPGWTFTGWSSECAGTDPCSVTMTSDKTITATFTQDEYTLNVASEHGTVTKSPDQATYHYGDVVQLQATAAEDWEFTDWTGDVTGTDNPVSITINGNTNVTANYTGTAPLYVHTLVLQPNGTNGVDTYILNTSASSNYGTSSSMGIGENNNSTNKYSRSLIKFDLNTLPADATIVSASLSLWTSSDLSSNDATYSVYRLKKAFNETQATWNNAATGTPWQSPGAAGANDREATAIGSVQILNNETLNTEKQILIDPAKIQEMFNGSFANNGLIIVANTELNNRFDFKTSDTSTASQRPKLVIQYTSPSTPPGLIFRDGFESGNFSAWSNADTDGGDLFVSTQSAAIGAYGMEALADDQNTIEVDDETINDVSHYTARFYMNPNSISMTENDSVYILSGDTDPNGWAFCMRMEKSGNYYKLSICVMDDTDVMIGGREVYITDDWQAVEIEWKAATASGANDGYMKFWINDVLMDTISGIDSDASRITDSSIGLITSHPADINGSMYFDAFVSSQGGHIGLDLNGPALTPALTDLIFIDGFESNNFSAWNWATTDGGDLSVSQQSAGIGQFGAQALVDDSGDMTLYDGSPDGEKHINTRFYFDPNSIQVTSNDGFILHAESSSTGWVGCLYFEQQGTFYSLALCGEDDAGNWLAGPPILITDGWQAVEVEWQAATAPGANNGYMKLYIGDQLASTIANIDNDTQAINETSLSVDGTFVGSGTVYFDDYESRTNGHIGLHPGGPVVPTSPARPDVLFNDDFEGGNLSKWSPTLSVIDVGDLAVSQSAAYQSGYGLKALIDDTTSIRAVDLSPAAESRYRARFYFDPNSIVMNSGNAHYILDGYNESSDEQIFRLELLYENGQYKLRPRVMNDAWSNETGSKYPISDDWHMIEIEWKRASAPGANDGLFSLWIDETLAGTLAYVDNDASYNVLDEVRLGATSGVDSTTSGSMYFDNFVSHRETYIGSGSTTPTATPTSLPSSGSITVPIISGEDDVEEANSGWMYFDSSDLELTTDSNAQQVGMRFTGVNLPQGATILNAYVQFTVDETSSEATSLMVQAEAADNSVNFSSSGKVSIRPRTSSSVLWEPLAWTTLDESGPNQRTPDLSAVIQEVVNRSGWVPGNAISVLVTGTGKRVAVAYEGNASQAPYLVVEYTTEPVATPTVTPGETPTPTETPTLEPTPTETPTTTPTPLVNLPGGMYSNVSLNLPAALQIRSDYLPSVQGTNVVTTIDYTYDALHRVTGASYSDGRSFSYTYDANGNALTYTNQSAVTSYQYDVANQLQTAQIGESLWYYVYDANGSLVEVLPNNTETSGAKRYTYNTAGYLTQVEAHSGSGWDVQAEMGYNGLGQRLGMDASGVIAYYVMDGNRPLTATTGTDTTSYLYGLGAIGEETDAWSYGLTDGANTQRQLTDATGEVTYSARYTPWGDTLDASGLGNFAFGYFGGLMDAATGLLYVGDGQYYDPSTGRFLTRNTKPNQSNPYLPFDPMGAMLGPLGVLALVLGSKKKKSKYDVLLFVLVFAAFSGMTLTACGASTPTQVTATVTQAPTATQIIVSTPTGTPIATATIPPAPIPVGTYTCIVSPLPNTEDMGGDWKITHYHYAMENDDAAYPRDYVTVGGLGTRQFRRQFIYDVNSGIPLQGTGLAEDGVTYITIDWDGTKALNHYPDDYDWWNHESPVNWLFKYGKGGRFAESTAWSSIAVSQSELNREGGLRNGDTVQIDGYCQTFIVTDTGSFTDAKHIDIFIGATTRADALAFGTKVNVKVWKVK